MMLLNQLLERIFALHAYIRKIERSQIHDLSFHHKKLETERTI